MGGYKVDFMLYIESIVENYWEIMTGFIPIILPTIGIILIFKIFKDLVLR